MLLIRKVLDNQKTWPAKRIRGSHRQLLSLPAGDLNNAVSVAKRNPEFEYGETARIEVRPVKTKEKSTSYVYPKAPDK
jgi:hypothetical protein